MYSVFPYGPEDHKKFQTALNQFTAPEVKTALEKNLDVVKKIIHEASANNFLTLELIKFVDKVINSEVNLTEKPGDVIANQIDELYEKPINLTDAELKLVEEANQRSVDSTLPPELALAISKHAQAEGSKELFELDPKSKTLEKAMFLGMFNDITRMQWLKNPNNLKEKNLETPNGNWQYLADSFRGGHTLAVNSDAYRVPEKSQNLLAVLADGVTYSYPSSIQQAHTDSDLYQNRHSPVNKTNTGLFTGSYFAKALVNKIDKFDFESFGKIDEAKSIDMDDLSNEADDRRIEINSDIFGFFSELQEKGFAYDSSNKKEDFFSQTKTFLENQGDTNAVEALDEPNLRASIIALAPFYKFQDSVVQELQNIYHGIALEKSPASTLNYALAIGNKIVTVKFVDSDIACYDKDGKKLSERTQFKQDPLKASYKIDNVEVFGDTHLGIDLDENNQLIKASVPPYKLGSKHLGNLSVTVYDKEDVDQIVLTSDGCLDKKKTLAQQMSPDSKQKFIDLISNQDSDDKTVIVLKKAS